MIAGDTVYLVLTEGAPPGVSEEELLGLLTMTLIESQCQHLVSNLYYTSHYVFSLPDHHSLRYTSYATLW